MRISYIQKNAFSPRILWGIIAVFTLVILPTTVRAEDVRFNNENWFVLPHPKVASFTVNPDGSAFGMTENGIPFLQENVYNDLGLRIQKFVIEDHYHYIVEGKELYTLRQLSAAMAQAFESMGERGA